MNAVDLLTLLVGSLLPSALVSFAAGFLVRRWANRWGLVDQPNARKVHVSPVPLGGGLAIWLGVSLPLLAACAVGTLAAGRFEDWLPSVVSNNVEGIQSKAGDVAWLWLCGTLLMALGLGDDRQGLDWRLRLGVELAVAGLVVATGWRFSLFLEMPWLTGGLTIFWIVALVNSFNMLDNMDGLSSGVAVISCSILACVVLLVPEAPQRSPQWFVAGFLLVLVGALLGFLWHNRTPSRLFMGDAGSYFIGYWIALSTILATFANRDLPPHTILAPLCILAVPLYDMTTVIVIRLYQGRSPFQADKNHFSHRLTMLGMTRRQAVWTIYLTTFTTGLAGVILYQAVNWWQAGLTLMLVFCILLLIALLELAAQRKGKDE